MPDKIELVRELLRKEMDVLHLHIEEAIRIGDLKLMLVFAATLSQAMVDQAHVATVLLGNMEVPESFGKAMDALRETQKNVTAAMDAERAEERDVGQSLH